MADLIEAILFDMGGTLRGSTKKDQALKLETVGKIIALLGAEAAPEEFASLLTQRSKAYARWSRKTLVEVDERELWTKWMLPDWPAGQIANIAVQLNETWREAIADRIIFPETKPVILELFRRGYRLGLVSNTTSSVEVPKALAELNISGCFETIILSTQVGKRKPDPAILLEATGRMGVSPDKCVYVGNRMDRDVLPSRKAGFSQVILLRDGEAPVLGDEPAFEPDIFITNLAELLQIFPSRPAPKPALVYNASLSTMWATQNFTTLPDFFEAARRLGFTEIELNHKVTSEMLAGIDLARYKFSSVHEPCPADIDEAEMKKRDWLISSTDEICRQEGVRAVQRSIDLARRAGARLVVIHAGQSTPDKDGLEKKLRAMIDTPEQDSVVYRAIQERMIHLRKTNAATSFASVQRSIQELLAYASPLGICLGIENRYHYLEHPNPDELGVLLSLAGPEQIGFQYDVGHAHTLDRLGFIPHLEWLMRFSSRMVGIHLHDTTGVTDHRLPGTGEIDFARISGYLPRTAIHTLELNNHLDYDEVRGALEYLAQQSCLHAG